MNIYVFMMLELCSALLCISCCDNDSAELKQLSLETEHQSGMDSDLTDIASREKMMERISRIGSPHDQKIRADYKYLQQYSPNMLVRRTYEFPNMTLRQALESVNRMNNLHLQFIIPSGDAVKIPAFSSSNSDVVSILYTLARLSRTELSIEDGSVCFTSLTEEEIRSKRK